MQTPTLIRCKGFFEQYEATLASLAELDKATAELGAIKKDPPAYTAEAMINAIEKADNARADFKRQDDQLDAALRSMVKGAMEDKP